MNKEKEIVMEEIEMEQEVKIDYKNDTKGKKQMRMNERVDKIEYKRDDQIKSEISEVSNQKSLTLAAGQAEINSDINQDNFDNSETIQKFKVPLSLKKTFLCSMLLFAIGITLIVLGSIQQIAAADPGVGIAFWVLGSIILIPGGYYSYQFYKARKARSYDERQEILDEIPEL